MPEGDSIHRVRDRLTPILAGRVATTVWVAKLKGHRPRAGMTIRSVRAHGKHLLIDFALPTGNTLSLASHLGMVGSWRVVDDDRPVTIPPSDHKARIVVGTENGTAVCRLAPSITTFVHQGEAVSDVPGRFGDDLILLHQAGFDDPSVLDRGLERIVGRARRQIEAEVGRTGRAPTMAELLLDQWVAAGIGNIYKSEALYAEGVWPFTPADRIDDDMIIGLYRAAAAMLADGAAEGRRPDGVYDRARRSCRRCGAAVAADRGRSDRFRGLADRRSPRGPSGPQRSCMSGLIRVSSGEAAPIRSSPNDRVTFWCPRCQPEPVRSSP